jgi:uncharacterized protein (TIGR04222 family)
MIVEVPTGTAWLLVLIACALRTPPRGRRAAGGAGRRLSAVETGLLRGGTWGAVQTALVELYVADSVRAVRQQAVRRNHGRPPKDCSALAQVLYRVLFGELHPRRLLRIDRVQQAAREVSRQLEREGLVLSVRRVVLIRVVLIPAFVAALVAMVSGRESRAGFLLALLAAGVAVTLGALPRRTRRGSTLLARLRHEQAGAGRATEREPDELLLSTGLFGAPALRAQIPRFTADSGLLTRPPREPMERGGGSQDANVPEG